MQNCELAHSHPYSVRLLWPRRHRGAGCRFQRRTAVMGGNIRRLAAISIFSLISAVTFAAEGKSLITYGEQNVSRNVDRADGWRHGLIGAYSATFDVNQLSVTNVASQPRGESTHNFVARRSLTAALPGQDNEVVLNLTTIYEGTNGVVTHAGTVAGDDGSLVTISIQGDEVLGKIHTNRLLYLLEGSSASNYTLTVIDSARLPKNRPIAHEIAHLADSVGTGHEAASSDGLGGGVSLQATGGNVGTLVLYTPAVAARNNISLLANGIIAQTNASLAASGVDSSNYLTMADLRPLSSNLSSVGSRCRVEIFGDVVNRMGAFSDLDTRLANADADIVLILVTTETGYTECEYGYGRFGGAAFIHDPDHPFAISTDTYALGDLTALHEVGHVLGGDHEGGVDGALSYAYGYATPSCAWQTMMAGYIDCAFDYDEPYPHLQPVDRLPRWSNPSLTYGGLPTGTATKNMKAALNVLMPGVSDWESDPAAPGSPSTFIVTSWLCHGTYTASWSATTGATHYQLMASTSSAFTSPYLMQIASGSTSAIFDIAQYETLYVRVRACNAGGCGGYSTQRIADDYYPICV
jgi:hypothetical protein